MEAAEGGEVSEWKVLQDVSQRTEMTLFAEIRLCEILTDWRGAIHDNCDENGRELTE
ncbi:hypothetical protein PAENIP36_28140 [Paenibacillus sp. P36]